MSKGNNGYPSFLNVLQYLYSLNLPHPIEYHNKQRTSWFGHASNKPLKTSLFHLDVEGLCFEFHLNTIGFFATYADYKAKFSKQQVHNKGSSADETTSTLTFSTNIVPG